MFHFYAKMFEHEKGVVTRHSTPYNQSGNGQVERYNYVIWKCIPLALNDIDALHKI